MSSDHVVPVIIDNAVSVVDSNIGEDDEDDDDAILVEKGTNDDSVLLDPRKLLLELAKARSVIIVGSCLDIPLMKCLLCIDLVIMTCAVCGFRNGWSGCY